MTALARERLRYDGSALVTAVPPDTWRDDAGAAELPERARVDIRVMELSLQDPERFGVIFDRYFSEIAPTAVLNLLRARAFGRAYLSRGSQFTAALVRSLGGRVREVRLDRIVDGAYAATVEVESPQGVRPVDARSSDALNPAVLTQAPVFAAPQMLADCIGRQEGDSAETALLQRAIAAGPMAVRRAD